MFLSNRDILYALERGHLVIRPRPEDKAHDLTTVDLHLGGIKDGARVWDVAAFNRDQKPSGGFPGEVNVGRFEYRGFADRYLIPVPDQSEDDDRLVFCRGNAVVVRPGGYVLWMTREWIETPYDDARLITFVNAKSTRARLGMVVHMTAPTIQAGWGGQITLEIGNFGPFSLVLEPGAAICQLTVATISSTPDRNLLPEASQTAGQTDPGGAPPSTKAQARKKGQTG